MSLSRVEVAAAQSGSLNSMNLQARFQEKQLFNLFLAMFPAHLNNDSAHDLVSFAAVRSCRPHFISLTRFDGQQLVTGLRCLMGRRKSAEAEEEKVAVDSSCAWMEREKSRRRQLCSPNATEMAQMQRRKLERKQRRQRNAFVCVLPQ